jgi:hypothetical protein
MRQVPVEIDISAGFNKGQSPLIQNQECINLYPVIMERPGLTQVALRSIRGITEVANAGGDSYFARGVIVAGQTPYLVLGDGLYSMDAMENLTYLGAIPGITEVSMATNGGQVMILEPGGSGFIFTIATGILVQITSVNFRANGNPQIVVFIDGYFVCTTDTRRFTVSSLNDGLTWAALDFGTAESDPDDIVAPAVVSNTLVIFGTVTGEQFQNIGGSGFPFQRTGFVLEKGLSARFSLVTGDGKAFFVGRGKQEAPAIWAASANGAQKISTAAIDQLLNSLNSAQISAIKGWSYAENGESFIGFTLPNTTIVFDLVTGIWAERKSYIGNVLKAWRPHSVFNAYGKMFVTDRVDGRIGMFTDTTNTEYGNRIIKRLVVAPFSAESFAFFVPMIEITMETGLLALDATDTTIDLEQSDDCKTWDRIRPRSVGATGQYKQRVFWNRNGKANRFRSWRLTTSVDTRIVIASMKATIIRGEK